MIPIINGFDKDELKELISIAQGVLSSLFSSDEIKDCIKDILVNVSTKETCITTINRYVELT